MNFLRLSIALVLLTHGPLPLAGEACTYDEALLALRQGNTLRAEALLRMARTDGDPRAAELLAQREGLMALRLEPALTPVITPSPVIKRD